MKPKKLLLVISSLFVVSTLSGCDIPNLENSNHSITVPSQEVKTIVSITKTKTEGNVDTYTITYSDKTTFNFTVTNGKDGEQGIQGVPGKDGKTPVITIGENGNWFIDGVDSNISAKGEKGDTGETGPQGPQGEKGDKGDTGETGSKGDKGDTAYSNTILPIEFGYISVNKGSFLVGEDVTFTLHTDVSAADYTINWEFNGQVDSSAENKFSVTKTMIEGGFAVRVSFVKNNSISIDSNGNLALNTQKELEAGETVIFGTSQNLENVTSISIDEKLKDHPIVIKGNGNNSINAIKQINSSIKNVTFEDIDFVLDSESTQSTLFNSTNIDNFNLKNVDIKVKSEIKDRVFTVGAKEINIDNVNLDIDSSLTSSTSYFGDINSKLVGSINITNSTFSGAKGTGIFFQTLDDDAALNISNSTFNVKGSFLMLADYSKSDKGININLEDLNINVENKINPVIQLNVWGKYDSSSTTFTPTSNTFENAIVNVNNVKVNDSLISVENNNYTTTYAAYSGSTRSMGVTNGGGLLSVMNATWGNGGYTYFAPYSNATSLEIDYSKYPTNITLNGNDFDINSNKLVNIMPLTYSEYAYIDGKLYKNVIRKADGSLVSGTLVESKVQFASGSGTLEDPLVINSSEQFKAISESSDLQKVYYKLSSDLELGQNALDLTSAAKSIHLDLNGHTINGDKTSITVPSEKEVVIENGKLDLISAAATNANVGVQDNGKLTLRNVEATATGSFLVVGSEGIKTDGTEVLIENCTIKALVYGVSTNASKGTKETQPGKLTINNSHIEVTDNKGQDNCAVLINVPMDANITSSTLIAQRQGLIVRGGDVEVSDSTIELNGKFTGKDYLDSNWESGNEVPTAAIVLGSHSESTYPYNKHLTLTNTKIKTLEGSTAIYLRGAGESLSTSLTYDELSTYNENKLEDSNIVKYSGNTFYTITVK